MPTATVDLLTDLLHRPSPDPGSPALPAGSRTAAALARAVLGWRTTRRDAEATLLDHLAGIRDFAHRAFSHDAASARRLREVMR
ncbi:hypothetical protein A605_12705 [Corynebacterium halotolerans YIM 70093 = DSM 44683]|uniref:Uncharacterized protein n=1 Tax=Corynebacterium halotolerans YIM 70093 = DSM 44683 TaxID=1121362 RepID=M1NVP5_9CORY|nr:hypothetical protein A605_12705 [Corynebacterium halotolerans YIM 70093 = DSM 44683]